MNCPSCGLYHPKGYEQCVSCRAPFNVQTQVQTQPTDVESTDIPDTENNAYEKKTNSVRQKSIKSMKMPSSLGIFFACLIILISAGVTVFFLTKAPEYERLYQSGEKELANGQFAFAVKTFEQAYAIKPKEPKILLALARAYVGVDQVEKAWDCIVQAQQLGLGVAAEPALASDLANYYRQHNQYERAVQLLRPLADANIRGKKAELADLDALFGDDCLANGDLRQALKCWEEVKDLQEGSRFKEADSRLSTIYQKQANESLAHGDDVEALACLNKLNMLAPSATSYEKTADIYQMEGKYDLAMDQLRKAIKLSDSSGFLDKKLASLMASKGKELLDSGEAEEGFGYLQQAQSLDNKIKVPSATIRGSKIDLDLGSASANFTGQVWNPGPRELSSLSLRVELFDTNKSSAIWSRETRIIDDFVPPLAAKDGKGFEFTINGVNKNDGSLEIRTYIDDALYKAYPIGEKSRSKTIKSNKIEKIEKTEEKVEKSHKANETDMHSPEPLPAVEKSPDNAPDGRGLSPEEKTLRDLD